MSDWADPHADNLLIRAASGLAMAVFGVAAAAAGGPWLAAATGAAVTAMAFEWARMSEPKGLNVAWGIAVAGALGAVFAASWGRLDAALVWLAALAVVSALRRRDWRGRFETGFGVLYVGAPCVAFLWMRGQEALGLAAILALFAIIWSADIAAYFGGRFIGGPRIAPSLSPRKTWAGVICGAAAAALAGYGLAVTLGAPQGLWVALGAGLGLVGLAGDLFESLCKRRFGVKDASNLIPGHGGVLDRLDGLMAASLAAAALYAAAPGMAEALFSSG